MRCHKCGHNIGKSHPSNTYYYCRNALCYFFTNAYPFRKAVKAPR